jgi:hypothetical protein
LIVIDGQLYNRCCIDVRLVGQEKCFRKIITYKKEKKERKKKTYRVTNLAKS